MSSNAAQARRDVRYEPDESPPNLLSLGLGTQYAMLAVSGIVLSPTILIHTAGGNDAYLLWAVCAALAICGVTTVVQAVGVGRIGAGYVLLMGSSSAFTRRLRGGARAGRSGAAGHAHRRSVPVPVRPRGQVVGAAADIHPDGGRDRRHADPGDPGAPHPRQALRRTGGRLAGGGAGHGERDAARGPRDRAPWFRSRALVGAGGRHRGGSRDGGARLRTLRHGERPRGGLDRFASACLSRARPRVRTGVLGLAAGVRAGDRRGGDGHPWGRRRHPASVLAQAARHRFPVHPGRDIGRRSRQPGGGSPQTVRNSIDR